MFLYIRFVRHRDFPLFDVEIRLHITNYIDIINLGDLLISWLLGFDAYFVTDHIRSLLVLHKIVQ